MIPKADLLQSANAVRKSLERRRAKFCDQHRAGMDAETRDGDVLLALEREIDKLTKALERLESLVETINTMED